MSEMIERVVKTLRDIDLTVGTPNYYQVAHAIIESMREPTNDMLTAEEVHPSCHMCGGHLEGWHNMIDAALKAK